MCGCRCQLYERAGSRDCWAPGTGLVVFGAQGLEVVRVTKLFVGHLPFSATDEALEALFGQAGTVAAMRVSMVF